MIREDTFVTKKPRNNTKRKPSNKKHKDQKIIKAIEKIAEARQTFFLSLAGFMLSCNQEAFEKILASTIRLSPDAIYMHAPNTPQKSPIEYFVEFLDQPSQAQLKAVVDASFKKMLADTFETLKKLQTDNIQLPASSTATLNFLKHIRNAYSHGDIWTFIDHNKKRKHLAPLTWKSLTIQNDFHGKSCLGFISHIEGLQLCAELSNALLGILSCNMTALTNQIKSGVALSMDKDSFSVSAILVGGSLTKVVN